MLIMLVDDSRAMRMIQKRILNQIGYDSIVEASNGVEALTLVKSESPDLILLDWNMPEMNGLEFLESFRENDKSTPVIMVTTEAEKKQVLTAAKAGANNYVIKPFEPDTLKNKIEETLAKMK